MERYSFLLRTFKYMVDEHLEHDVNASEFSQRPEVV